MKAAGGNFIPQRLKRLALLMAVAVLPMLVSRGAHALNVGKINDQTAAELLAGAPHAGLVESIVAAVLDGFGGTLNMELIKNTGAARVDLIDTKSTEIAQRVSSSAREELQKEISNRLAETAKTEVVGRVFESLGESSAFSTLKCANTAYNAKGDPDINWARCESISGKKFDASQRVDITSLAALTHQATSTPAFQLSLSKAVCAGLQELSKRYTQGPFVDNLKLKTEVFEINMPGNSFSCEGVVSGEVEQASELLSSASISDELVVDGLLGEPGAGIVEAKMVPAISGIYSQLEQRRTNGGAGPWTQAGLKEILTRAAQPARLPLRTAMLARMKQAKLTPVAQQLDRSLGRNAFIIALRCAATARKAEPTQGADWSICEQGHGKKIGSEDRIGLESLVQVLAPATNEPESQIAVASAICRGAEILISGYSSQMLGGYLVPPGGLTVAVVGTQHSCNDILSGKVTVQ